MARYQTDVLELDVHLTRDGQVIVSHDATVDRCTDGTGEIAQLSFAELRALDAGFRFSPNAMHYPYRGRGVKLPSLVEVLRRFPTRLNIELKSQRPEAPEALARVLREEEAFDRVCIGAEDDAVAARLVQLAPEACHFYPREALGAFVMAVRSGEPPPRDERFSVLDMPLYFQGIRLFDEALRAAAAEHGKWVNVWTIDDPVEMRQLVKEGVGGVMTDRPDLLRAELS